MFRLVLALMVFLTGAFWVITNSPPVLDIWGRLFLFIMLFFGGVNLPMGLDELRDA